jgi:hypothetical protein
MKHALFITDRISCIVFGQFATPAAEPVVLLPHDGTCVSFFALYYCFVLRAASCYDRLSPFHMMIYINVHCAEYHARLGGDLGYPQHTRRP